MLHSIGRPEAKRVFAVALAMTVALPLAGSLHATTKDDDYDLKAMPYSGVAQPADRPNPRFQYMFNEPPVRWPGALYWRYNHDNAPAPYSTNKTAAIQEIAAASEKWSAACGIQIIFDGETVTAPRTFIGGQPDEINIIGWQKPDIGISGATYSWYRYYSPSERALVDADIVLDPAYVTSSAQMARTVSHEWGHALGLGHSNVANALMSGSPDSPYSNFTDLTVDDVQGCRCLYGPPAFQAAGYVCSLPKDIDFGTLHAGATAPARQVTMTNAGNAALAITGFRTGSSEFFVGSSGCAPGAALVPGASCTFGVQARLAATGARNDELVIDTTEGPYRIPLHADGIAALPAAVNYEGVWSAAPAGSESGWGINFAHQDEVIFATWFTYDADGKAWWLTMTASRSGANVYAGTLYESRGPSFAAVPFNPAAVTQVAVGAATLTFTDANTALFAYTVNGVSQTKAITRVVFGSLPTCIFGAQPNLALATNYQDVWWAAAAGESGWGVNFTHQGDIIFATWFTYDFDGTPLWLSVTAPKIAAGVYRGTLQRTTGPAFNALPFDPLNVVRTSVGTLTLTFANGNDATFAYTLTLGTPPVSVTQSKQLARLVFRAPGTVCQ